MLCSVAWFFLQLAQDKSTLRLGTDDDLQLLSTQNDELGYRHYRYQQTYKGIPIEGAIYLMHEKNNRTKKANGKLISHISLHTVPHLSEVLALQSALQYVGADVYAWEDANHQALIQQVEQCEEATFYPSGELVIIDPDFGQNPYNYRLAYKFDIYAITPLSRQVVYIDAQNSAVCQENGIHTLKNHVGGVTQQVFNANNTLSNPLIPCTGIALIETVWTTTAHHCTVGYTMAMIIITPDGTPDGTAHGCFTVTETIIITAHGQHQM